MPYRDVAPVRYDEIVLVDDNSTDNRIEISRAMGISTTVHQKNHA
jgi:glycosyltransferase involved in cell wall biosynthesis